MRINRLQTLRKRRRQFFFAALTALSTHRLLAGTVVIDHSFGHTTTLTGPNFIVPQSAGLTRGGNLFQSLKTLRIAPGESLTFTGSPKIQNVLTRITGGSPASINGTLRCTIPKATFYLISPAGVVFGPSATLDLGGSFVVSTAERTNLADGHVFGSVADKDNTLTSAAPTAFGFLSPTPSAVTFNGSAINVPTKQSITIAAGPVTLSHGAIVRAATGTIAVSSVAEPTTAVMVKNNPPAVPETALRGRVSLTGQSELVTTGAGGGRIAVIAQDLMLNNSGLDATTKGQTNGRAIDLKLTGTLTNSGGYVHTNTYGSGDGGGIDIRANRIVADRGSSALTDGFDSQVRAEASGAGGSIFAHANEVKVTAGQDFSVSTFGSGKGGGLTVVSPSILIDGIGGTSERSTGLFANALGTGTAGNLRIHARHLTIVSGGEIDSNTFAKGNAGNIKLKTEDLAVDGQAINTFTGIASNAEGSGAAGTIAISTRSASVVAGGEIISDTVAKGNAGALQIVADELKLDGRGSASVVTAISSDANSGSTGAAGSVSIQANDLSVLHGGIISSDTFGLGRGGDVKVSAESFFIDGRGESRPTGVSSDSLDEMSGNAGMVRVKAQALSLTAGQISSQTYGSGAAGDVVVVAGDLKLNGHDPKTATYISSDTNSSSGHAGVVRVHVRNMSVLNSAYISSDTYGSGDGGNVSISANAVRVGGSDKYGYISSISTDSPQGATGNAGDLSIRSQSLEVSNNGIVESSTSGRGAAGALTFTANEMQILSGGNVNADTSGSGAGGRIQIACGSLLVDGSATSAFTGIASEALQNSTGRAGTIAINAGTMRVLGGGEVASSTFANGDSGDVYVSSDHFLIDGRTSESFTGITAQNNTGGNGNAGLIFVNAGDATVLGGGAIVTDTHGKGNAGNIRIRAKKLSLDGTETPTSTVTSISSDAEPSSAGNAGAINITADQLIIRSQARVDTGAKGLGHGGNITISAKDMTLDGVQRSNLLPTGILARSTGATSGNAGGVNVTVGDKLQLLNDSEITTGALHAGGGSTLIHADELDIIDGQIVTNSAKAGGNIEIGADRRLSLYASSHIQANSSGASHGDKGGNLTIGRTSLVFLPGVTSNAISANANRGNGGNITIAPGLFLQSPGTPADAINASSVGGIAGTISVQQPNLDLTGQLVPLVTALDSKNISLAPTCGMRITGTQSSFTLEGGNGLPVAPEDLTSGDCNRESESHQRANSK